MLKELKYLFFLIVILLFFFLTLRYYFSENNEKNSYRAINFLDKKISNYSQSLILLKSDTIDIVEYIEKNMNKNKKSYNFWNLINTNE